MKIYSFSPFGYEGALVTVEVDLRRGIPAIDIVGLADGAVKESRERMQAAIRNSGFEFPLERVLISLSPADVKKEGAGFDLPIALSVLFSNSDLTNSEQSFISESILVMGELELSGRIRPVKGVNAAVATAVTMGIKRCIVPVENQDEACEVAGMMVCGAKDLQEAFRALKDHSIYKMCSDSTRGNYLPAGAMEYDGVFFSDVVDGYEFSELKGQYKLVRALQIAAAGGHNLLAVGAPGCGKTMSIQKFPALNPILTIDEAQVVTRIWSLAGLIKPSEPLIRVPPFRLPHQTATIEGICGGGPNCRPGEISLAHNGVLFLDEAAEFKSSILQMLRVPLENGQITLCRAGRSTVYPANFQLLMATNPCPCGNYGAKTKLCLCSAKSIEMYWKKFSGPLLDRIDLRVFVENNSEENKSTTAERDGLQSTEEIRLGIAKAVNMQRKRQNKKNSMLTPQELGEFCKLTESCQKLLDSAIEKFGFSARAISSILKTARTIADISGVNYINETHLTEAIDYRKLCSDITLEL